MMLKKCLGESAKGMICPDKWTCQRYYSIEGPAGRIEPNLSERGCLDFVALGSGRQEAAVSAFAHHGYLPGLGGGD